MKMINEHLNLNVKVSLFQVPSFSTLICHTLQLGLALGSLDDHLIGTKQNSNAFLLIGSPDLAVLKSPEAFVMGVLESIVLSCRDDGDLGLKLV